MFNSNIYLGVTLAILFICGVTWFVIHKTKSLVAQEKILFLLIFLVSIVSAVWVVDRILAHQINLLTPEESKSIFEIIRNIIAVVLGYYFGIKKSEKE